MPESPSTIQCLKPVVRMQVLQVNFVLVFLSCVLVHAEENLTLLEVGDQIRHNYIIPDIIYNPPTHKLKVTFKNGTVPVEYGNFLTHEQTKNQPELKWPSNPNDKYAILTVMYHLVILSCFQQLYHTSGSDVPSRADPQLRDWVYWLVVNIKGNNISSGYVKHSWQGPDSTPTVGESRYTFIVFKQDPNFPMMFNRTYHTNLLDDSEAEGLPENSMWDKRSNFITDYFVSNFRLKDPWALNFFLSKPNGSHK